MTSFRHFLQTLLKFCCLWLLLLAVAWAPRAHAQAYITQSRVIGGTGAQTVVDLAVADGYSYILGTTTGNDYPVTLGGTPAGTLAKGTLTKLDASGNIVWARYLPFGSGNATNTYTKMVLQNGVLYLAGSTTSADVPVTNGSVYGGGTSEVQFTKVNAANGNIIHNGYLGGSGADGGGIDLAVENGYAYLTYITGSADIPVTTGPAYTTSNERVVQKIDPAGNIAYSTYTGQLSFGSILQIEAASLKVENGITYAALTITTTNQFITTDGSAVVGSSDIAMLRLDANGNRTLATIIGGSASEANPQLAVHNGEMYFTACSQSTNYPVTDGSSKSQSTGIVITKINSNGNLVYSGVRGSQTSLTVRDIKPVIQYKNGSVYLGLAVISGTLGVTATDGSTGGNALIKLDAATGAVQYATRFGENRTSTSAGTFVDMVITDEAIYTTSPIQNTTAATTAFVTNGSTRTSQSGTFVAKHSLTGQLLYASFLTTRTGTATSTGLYPLAVENGKMYVSGATIDGNGWPVTQPALGTMNQADQAWTVLEFCPTAPTANTISPLSQTICQGGLVQQLTGTEVLFPSSQVPQVYINGTANDQTEIRPRYQWQSSTTSSGPWINISAGTQKDYIPPTAAQNLYYRRLVLPPLGCGETPFSISPVAEILVNANAAPSVTSAVFNTCSNNAVNISLDVTGGITPYTYAWDNGISSTTNSATVTPATNSVYTLTVTDANGCQQVGQAIVNAHAADAGLATAVVCAGKPVRIGTPQPAGLVGVTYSWTPTTGLDDPTAAQPMATPGVTTVYTVEMTVPVSGGGTCTTSDNVTVNVQAGPATTNFAGDDKAVCKGGTVSLGTAAEPGFTYTWTPGSYLSTVAASTTNFSAGTGMPNPNPYIYTLTASINGCTFTDQVAVSVLDVDAGDSYCGPRNVGTADKIPGVTGKTWLWEVVSGNGTITGATNTAITTVSASTGGPTTYRLTVSYLGISCSDEVVVPEGCAGGCPEVNIDTITNSGCPATALGPVSLRADPSNLDPSAWTYTWSSVPAGGLSGTTGATVSLTDNVERDVTLTVSRVDNPAVSCSHTIHVNDPSWSLPVFNAPDQAVCSNTPVGIGTTAVAGYMYTWQGVSNGDVHASNPTVLPAATTFYPVTIEDVGSRCIKYDTVKVTVKPLVANAGPDWTACSNALITLGGAAQPGVTYSWDPQVASYQNGTDHQSSQPQLLIATTQDFTLTVTDTETGCTLDSTITITIDENNTLPAMPNQTICPGGSATIGLPAMNGVTYSWSPATGLSSTTVAQPEANPTISQTYTLTATFYDINGSPACTKTGSVTVTVAGPEISMSDESVCPSGALYNLGSGVTVTGATSYHWSPEILVNNPADLNTTVKTNPNAPTSFTLTATDATGCSVSATKLVSPVNAAPDAGSSGFVCVGSSRSLGNAANTGSLSWSVSPAIAGTFTPANGAEPVFTPAAADAGKTFTFTLTQDIGGCINTDVTTIQVRSLVLPAMPPQTVCMNAPATIGVPAQQGVTYAWSPVTGLSDASAATTTVSSVTGNGMYTLTATDVFGCSATGMAAVGVSAQPAPTVNIPTVTVGVGTAGSPFLPEVSPMPADYSYSWTPAGQVNDPYIANATAIPGNAGTYTYQLAVTDAFGCTTNATAMLNVVPGSALPITLSSFKQAVQGCGVRLQWTVESFENFSHFIVERSSNGADFTAIGRVNHLEYRSHYTFDDADPGNGLWFYRLKLVDRDEKYEYSPIVFAKVNCAAPGTLSVYPNPVKDLLYIKSSKPVKHISLVTVTGQMMARQLYNQTQPGIIKMSLEHSLKPGMYFLLITAVDGTVQNRKVLKD